MPKTMLNIRMIQTLRILCVLCCLLPVCVACTDSDEWQPQPDAGRVLTLKIGDKPPYRVESVIEEMGRADTRLAANGSSYKWETGDVLYIYVQMFASQTSSYTYKMVTATYSAAGAWTLSDPISSPSGNDKVKLVAWHAPGTLSGNVVTLTNNSNLIMGLSDEIGSGTTEVPLTMSLPLMRMEVKNASASAPFDAVLNFPATLDISKSFESGYLTSSTRAITDNGVYYVVAEAHDVVCTRKRLQLMPNAGSYAGQSYVIDCSNYSNGMVRPEQMLRGIWTADDLIEFGTVDDATLREKYVDSGVVNLYADIDMNGKNYTPRENMLYSFNGWGHTIFNLKTQNAGLFRYIFDPEIVIKGVNLKNVDVTATESYYSEHYAGGLIGEMRGGYVIACTVQGKITALGGYTHDGVGGGIVGKAYRGTIIACSFVGGFISKNGAIMTGIAGIPGEYDRIYNMNLYGCYSDITLMLDAGGNADFYYFGIVTSFGIVEGTCEGCYYFDSHPYSNVNGQPKDLGTSCMDGRIKNIEKLNYAVPADVMSGSNNLNTPILMWNVNRAPSPKFKCDYHYVKGADVTKDLPYLVKGVPKDKYYPEI